MQKSDHPLDNKRGGVFIYFKTSLAIRVLQIQKLKECVFLKIKNDEKAFIFSVLYRSPSQNSEKFAQFLENLEFDLNNIFARNPLIITIFGYFDANSSNWWDGNKTTYEGLQIDSLT